jgi:hypothetical protein
MKDWQGGLAEMFGPDLVAHPAYPAVIAVTTPLIRGLAVTRSLTTSRTTLERSLDAWAAFARQALDVDRTDPPTAAFARPAAREAAEPTP